jgi:hypothetical protein
MMKTVILFGLIGALLTVPSPAAKMKDQPWPPFQVGVTGVMAAPVVPDLIGCFVREEHGWPRELYRRLLTKLLREDRPEPTNTVRGQVAELLGDDIVGGNFPRDHAYTMRGRDHAAVKPFPAKEIDYDL